MNQIWCVTAMAFLLMSCEHGRAYEASDRTSNGPRADNSANRAPAGAAVDQLARAVTSEYDEAPWYRIPVRVVPALDSLFAYHNEWKEKRVSSAAIKDGAMVTILDRGGNTAAMVTSIALTGDQPHCAVRVGEKSDVHPEWQHWTDIEGIVMINAWPPLHGDALVLHYCIYGNTPSFYTTDHGKLLVDMPKQ